MSTSEEKYKNTVTLPSTPFPMRANLSQTEPLRIEQWTKENLYQKILSKNSDQKKFVMPDGPPYANGNIHVGHVLNKVLKDIIIKYRNLKGEQAAFIPGWDCHGLPIELNVTKKLNQAKSKPSPAEFRNLCRQEALSWVHKQREQFQRLGILADWDHPYLTLDPQYEADEIRVVAHIHKNGGLQRGEKPVFWDPALQTALAAAEVEYKTHKSLSIYVKFKLEGVHKVFGLNDNRPLSVVIWTTTPWTLPANYGISVHPDFCYGIYEADGELLIIAQGLVDSVAKNIGRTLTEITRFPGNKLENLKAQNPLINRNSLLVLGDHVTLEAGTGCVHTAGAHGIEDYVVSTKYNLPTKSPVDAAGKFNNEIPELAGRSLWDGNKVIVDLLEKNQSLLALQEIEHQYPYGPRSKKPLIFRSTPQWFIRLDDPQAQIRQKTLKVIENDIHFVPKWGIQRLTAMVSNSPDWCLSRQRTWGVPVPVYYCKQCQEPLVHSDIMFKLADTMESTGLGIEVYYSHSPKHFTQGYSCSKCKGSEFEIGKDIMDVWFDSGSCHTAVQKRRNELNFPADIYIEGSDQHRGWFQTSLLSSMAAYGVPPFKALVTHGFVNDAQGFKMSKSQGNVVDPSEVIKDFGAEVLRIWVAHEDFGGDLTISKEMLHRIADTYRRFRNTLRFLLGNLNDFDPVSDRVAYSQMPKLDQWALAKLNVLIERCTEAYEHYEFYKVYHALNTFITVDLSATYLDVLKDRLYTSRKNGLPRRASQTVLYYLATKLSSLMAPIASFLAEETYQYIPGKKESSVFLAPFPQPKPEWNNDKLLEQFSQLLEIRAKSSKILEDLRIQKIIGSSLEAQLTLTASQELFVLLESFQSDLRELLIVSHVTLKKGDSLHITADRARGKKCVRCWHYDELTSENSPQPDLCPKCVEALS
ncbi:MAG: isoleucine--tRNA ligase [Bdellovibrionales bacterium]|nr:isoleucine--tRNA ligase [Bdellovibrionales bacterium]